MMNVLIRRLIAYTILFHLGIQARSQNAEYAQILKEYSSEPMVFLKNNETMNLGISNDKITIKRNSYSEIMFTNDFGMRYAYDEFHFTDFLNKIDYYKAYTRYPNPKKKSYSKEPVKDFEINKNTSEGVFYDDVTTISFSYPHPVKGAIGVKESQDFITDPHFLGKFYFANMSPTLESEFKVIADKRITLKYLIKNPTDDIKFVQTAQGNNIIYTWSRSNFAKVKGESNATSINYSEPHIFIYISEYESKAGSVSFMKNTQSLYDYYYSLLIKGVEPPQDAIKRTVDSLINPEDEAPEKLKSIYYYLQSKIKYIAIEDGLGGFVPRKPNEVFERKYGDCKDISNLLVTMLNLAGLEAYHCWVGTSDLPYRFDEMQVMGIANHMIAAVRIENRWYFLDGTSSNLSIDYPSDFVQGKQGMISITKDSFLLEYIPIVGHERNKTIDSISVRIVGDTVSGRGITKVNGLPKFSISSTLYFTEEKEHEEMLENYVELGQNNCSVTLIEYPKKVHQDSQLQIIYDFQIPHYIHQINENTYINLNLDRTWGESEIDIKNRTRGFQLDYTQSFEKVIKFEIPQGFKVKNIPPNSSFESKYFGFNFKYSVTDNHVILHQILWSDLLQMDPSTFEEWNQMVEKLALSYNQNLVLQTQ